MATTVLIARQLGPAGRGEYAVAIAITGIGVQVANLGVHTSSSWAVARSPKLLGPLLANGLVLAVILGSGYSSRLYQEVREKAGIVHSVDAWTYNPGLPGLFGMSEPVLTTQGRTVAIHDAERYPEFGQANDRKCRQAV